MACAGTTLPCAWWLRTKVNISDGELSALCNSVTRQDASLAKVKTQGKVPTPSACRMRVQGRGPSAGTDSVRLVLCSVLFCSLVQCSPLSGYTWNVNGYRHAPAALLLVINPRYPWVPEPGWTRWRCLVSDRTSILTSSSPKPSH